MIVKSHVKLLLLVYLKLFPAKGTFVPIRVILIVLETELDWLFMPKLGLVNLNASYLKMATKLES